MISTFSVLEKNTSGPELMQIDAAQYKPFLQGKMTNIVEKGYDIIVATQNTCYQSIQLSQRV
jgi:hypothetical protein